MIPTLAGKAIGRKGMAFANLIGDWAVIVGPDWAARLTPFKLIFPPGQRQDATLHLRLPAAAALEVQHAEPQILERINAYFGFHAVARLKLVQAPQTGMPRRRPPPKPLDPAQAAGVGEAVAAIEDPELREALERFGHAVLGARPRRPSGR
jgi:hypothetical protein